MTTPAERTVSEHKRPAAQDVSSYRRNGHLDRTGRDEFIAWLIASCQRQDVPVSITDPTALATIATLLR
jgi:hypothetical protein